MRNSFSLNQTVVLRRLFAFNIHETRRDETTTTQETTNDVDKRPVRRKFHLNERLKGATRKSNVNSETKRPLLLLRDKKELFHTHAHTHTYTVTCTHTHTHSEKNRLIISIVLSLYARNVMAANARAHAHTHIYCYSSI